MRRRTLAPTVTAAVKTVEIGSPETQDPRVSGPSLLEKTKVVQGRDESSIVARIPYLNTVKHTV